MATPRKGTSRPLPGFDVTIEQVIGRVECKPDGAGIHPIEAAFRMIGDRCRMDGEGGRFKFVDDVTFSNGDKVVFDLNVDVNHVRGS
jgi:hypothetical protein